MAPSHRDVQLTSISDDLEDVRLLDSFDIEQQEEENGRKEKKLRKIELKITGMTCSACTNLVESAVNGVNGVDKVSVSLLQNKAFVVFDPDFVKDEDIKEAIEDAGFEAAVLPDSNKTRLGSQKTLTGQFRIGGMTCAACVNSVEGIFFKLPGVRRAVVALVTSLAEVEYDPTALSKEDIVNAIEDAGFDASFLQSSEEDKTFLSVEGLLRDMDVEVLHNILRNITGVKQFEVNNTLSEVEVVFDPEATGLRFIVDAIESQSSGKFKVHVRNQYARAASNDAEQASKMFRLFISSLILSVPLFLMRLPYIKSLLLKQVGPFMISDLLKWVLVSIVQFVIGKRFYIAAYRALRNRSTNMDVLIALGTSASYLYSVCTLLYSAITGFSSLTYFETSAMLITFVLFGKYLEVVAKGKTSDAIKKLVELVPATSILLVKDAEGRVIKEREIDALLIQPGDVLKVLPGSKVPSDGMVVWGSSYVDESMVTGESQPIPKGVSSPVIGGTMNLHGALHIRATNVGSNTVLSQIISLVETAQMSKAPIQKFADYVASIFVPTVVLLSLLTFLGWFLCGSLGAYPSTWLSDNGSCFVFSLMFSISVVVIACPCALGLATPTAIMVATGVGASHGILIKGGDALERAQSIQYVIFDKTGTLTQGKASVTSARVFSGMDLGDFLTLVASAEVRPKSFSPPLIIG